MHSVQLRRILNIIVYYEENRVQRTTSIICVALRDLVPSAQFKKREKHPWRSVTFSKVAG